MMSELNTLLSGLSHSDIQHEKKEGKELIQGHGLVLPTEANPASFHARNRRDDFTHGSHFTFTPARE